MDSTIPIIVLVVGFAIFGALILISNNSLLAESGLSLQVYSDSVRNSSPAKEFTIVAEDTTLEIAPGVRVQAWTFNGTIPGPTLRATEGDIVIIHFINNSHLPHTIHLHGDHNEINDGVFQEVLPGSTYTYDFTAGPAGALMYHCHVMPVSEHVRNGLYGAFIVDPKEKLEAAREYVLVKGEYDLQDQTEPFPDYVFFNGYADQYWNSPLVAKTGELVRIYYVDMGAMPAYGFHIHGTIFEAIQSGLWENYPVKAQTWEVSPGNAAIFEAKWQESGRYLFHLHGIPEERGTMGYFDVTDPARNAVDGVDIARTKSINMWGWEKNQLISLEKPDEEAKPTVAALDKGLDHTLHGFVYTQPTVVETNSCEIEQGSAMKTSNRSFSPTAILVSQGDVVKWKNNDSGIHTVTSKDGTFDSGMILSGNEFEHKFDEKGNFEYFCSLHPWMQGAVQVS